MSEQKPAIRYLSEVPRFIDPLSALLNAEFDISHDGAALVARRARLESYAVSGEIPFTRVLTLGEALAGTVSLLNHDLFGLEERYPWGPWMASLYLLPEYRGRGWADLLQDDLFRILQLRGIGEVYLWTTDHLVPYYQARNWTGIGSVSYRGLAAVVMKRGTKGAPVQGGSPPGTV